MIEIFGTMGAQVDELIDQIQLDVETIPQTKNWNSSEVTRIISTQPDRHVVHIRQIRIEIQ